MQISSCSLAGLEESHNELASKCKGRSYLMLTVFQADHSFSIIFLCYLCSLHPAQPAPRLPPLQCPSPAKLSQQTAEPRAGKTKEEFPVVLVFVFPTATAWDGSKSPPLQLCLWRMWVPSITSEFCITSSRQLGANADLSSSVLRFVFYPTSPSM